MKRTIHLENLLAALAGSLFILAGPILSALGVIGG